MIDYTLSSLSDRLDSSFLIACLLPAFFAVLGNIALFTVLVGPDAMAAWLYNLGSFEETIVAVIILVVIMMVGLLLRALSFVTVGFFVGELLPRSVAAWSTRGQQRAQSRAQRLPGDAADSSSAHPLRDQVRRLVEQRYPQDETALRPTRLGNMLAAGAEYPWTIYAMDGMLWWSHLTPVLPSYVSDALEGAQARLLGLLNLSLVFGVLACEAVVVLGLVGQQWTAALGVAVAGGVLAWLGYHAAVSQALEVTSQIRVAFNLYRQEILKQMGLDIPKTMAAERALWQTLTQELLGLSTEAAPTGDGTEKAAAAPTVGRSRRPRQRLSDQPVDGTVRDSAFSSITRNDRRAVRTRPQRERTVTRIPWPVTSSAASTRSAVSALRSSRSTREAPRSWGRRPWSI